MKTSHITTPRTMNDCEFMLNADPIERPDSHRSPLPRWSLWVGGAIAIAMLAMVATPARAAVDCDLVINPYHPCKSWANAADRGRVGALAVATP